MSLTWLRPGGTTVGRHDIQHNGIQQKVIICDIQHYNTQHNNTVIILNVFMLIVAFYLLLC
jgi:hypothetical protein